MENYTTKIIKLIESEIEENEPGLSIGVIKDGQCFFNYSYGYQNLEKKVRSSSSTIYHLASLSKQFTALSILLLEKRGLINLEDKIVKHLPELSDTYKNITIYQLIYHTSGVRDQLELLKLKGYDSSHNINNKQIIDLINCQKKLIFNPGSTLMYGSSSYTILAELIEQLTNKTLTQFCYENFFKESRMNKTFFYDNCKNKTEDFAESYILNDDKFIKLEYNLITVGGTGLKSTIDDLIKWEISIQKKELKDNDILIKSYKKGLLKDNSEVVYGAGVAITKYKNHDVYRHAGYDAGFRTHFLRFKNKNLSIVLLSNNGTLIAGELCDKVADILLDE